jgi:adenosylcobinamide kinase/adenosylcobinamide-phosphate guanylyltransferase
MHELILGGAKSGKSRAALARAQRWLETPGHEAVLLATAQAGDAEMAERIARHRADRAAQCPQLRCVEVGADLPAAIDAHAAPQRLLVVDCLTLWLTQLALPVHGAPATALALHDACDALVASLHGARGPLLCVSNEIGQGVLPLGAEVRRFVDALGLLHQAVAERCTRVTLVVAGQELRLKGPA